MERRLFLTGADRVTDLSESDSGMRKQGCLPGGWPASYLWATQNRLWLETRFPFCLLVCCVTLGKYPSTSESQPPLLTLKTRVQTSFMNHHPFSFPGSMVRWRCPLSRSVMGHVDLVSAPTARGALVHNLWLICTTWHSLWPVYYVSGTANHLGNSCL